MFLSLLIYIVFKGEKQLISSGYKKWEKCGGIYKNIIFNSLQAGSNYDVIWFLWPFIINNR